MNTTAKSIQSIILPLLLLAMFLPHIAQSQVMMGGNGITQPFSVLEITTNNKKGGLRLPQMTTAQRDSMTTAEFMANPYAEGLLLYNTSTKCVDSWNGKEWISLCNSTSTFVLTADSSNVDPFPNNGDKENTYTISDMQCTHTGSFTFTWISGEQFIDRLTVLDAGAGKFSIKFLPNDQAFERYAILLVTDPCGNSNSFVFTQEGDDSGCGTSAPVPDIKSENGLTLCSSGAVYLYLDGRPDGIYIWTLNGYEVGRGVNYVAQYSGKYSVYADKIGCPNSKSITVTSSPTLAPDPVHLIVNTNNGIVCDASSTTELIATGASDGNIVWYKDGVKQDNPAYNGQSTINAGVGLWQAVVENGDCSSAFSESALVYLDPLGGTAIPAPVMKINGKTSGWQLCTGGSIYMEVNNYNAQYTYTWYANNTQIGKGTGIYYPVPYASQVVLRLQVTGAGCAQEVNSVATISTTSAPSIPTISGRGALCGGSTILTINTQVASPFVTWYRDGNVIPNENGINLNVTIPGNYSATVADGDCVSPISATKSVILSDFTTLSWVQAPSDNGHFGELKTLQASATNEPVTYTWTVTLNGTDVTSSVITYGQGTSTVMAQYPTSGTDSDQLVISVHGTNACGLDLNDPLQMTVTLTNDCPTPTVIDPTAPATINALVGNQVMLSTTIKNTNQPTYTWYEYPSMTHVGDNSPTYTYTPTTVGTEQFICEGANGCDVGVTCTSPVFTVITSQDPANMPVGSGTLTGKVCFDIAESNFDNATCGTLAGRQAQKSDFTALPVNDKTYTFTATEPGSNFRFVVVDVENALDATTPYTVTQDLTGSFTSGSTAIIQLNFKTTLNSPVSDPLIVGRDKSQAAKVTVYAVFNNGSGDVAVPLIINIQDCQCCGAMISPTQWKAFMCHNLGADQSLDPFTPSRGINGSYYQWGKSTPVATVDTPTGAISGWNNSGYNATGWSDAAKLPGDPCPAGWRVPTESEWQGVKANNTMTYIGNFLTSNTTYTSGIKIGTNLFLPAAGLRSASSNNNGALFDHNLYGYYWSSSIYPGSIASFRTYIFTNNMNNIGQYLSGHAESIRCISEN